MPAIPPCDRPDNCRRADKCWVHLKAGKLGWAKAECDAALALGPASPQPKASLLFNEGLIAQKNGDSADARRYYEESLSLRPHPAVQSALDSLGL